MVTWQWSPGAILLFAGEGEKVCRYELEEMVVVNTCRGLILFWGWLGLKKFHRLPFPSDAACLMEDLGLVLQDTSTLAGAYG